MGSRALHLQCPLPDAWVSVERGSFGPVVLSYGSPFLVTVFSLPPPPPALLLSIMDSWFGRAEKFRRRWRRFEGASNRGKARA